MEAKAVSGTVAGWLLDCLKLPRRELMQTLGAWKAAHPGVNVLAFEANSDRTFGFGHNEEVCGFCLASHYFEDEPPRLCNFCRAPLRETHVISYFRRSLIVSTPSLWCDPRSDLAEEVCSSLLRIKPNKIRSRIA